jgi:hypothetical protein
MTHRRLVLLFVPLCLIAVLLPGCVPVTEPLSDPDKAEPDKRLLGKWQRGDEIQCCEIDSPAVKGNPKGLMRAVYDGRADDPQNAFWFFTTMIGKHTYATSYLEPGEALKCADFRKEGAFEKWNKGKDRRYFIFRFMLDGDKLTVDFGDKQAMTKLMQAEKIEGMDIKRMLYFKTPPGWLAKYLEKSGPEPLYKGADVQKWQREKK